MKPDPREHKVSRACKECKVRADTKDLAETKVPRATKETKGLKEFKDHVGTKGLVETKALKA